jgi:hypothetical protein
VSEVLPSGWFILGDYVCESVDVCTCGMLAMGTYYGHEPYCGVEPVMPVSEWRERGSQDGGPAR